MTAIRLFGRQLILPLLLLGLLVSPVFAQTTDPYIAGTSGLTSGNLVKSGSTVGQLQDAGANFGTLTDGDVCTYTASGTIVSCNVPQATCDGITITCPGKVFTAQPLSGFPGYVASNYYLPLNGISNTSNAGSAVASGTIYCMSGYIPQAIHISELGFSYGTPGTSNTQLAIYTNGSWGRPSTLVVSSGNFNNTLGAGQYSSAITSTSVGPGLYWWCSQSNDSTIKPRSWDGFAQNFPQLLGSATLANINGASPLEGILTTGVGFGVWSNFSSGTTWSDDTVGKTAAVTFKVGSVP